MGSARTVHGSGTPDLSFRPGGNYSSRRVVTMISGRWQTIIKNYSSRTIFVLMPIFIVYESAQLIGVLMKGWWPEWCTALKSVRGQYHSLIKSRNVIQSSRCVPDRQLLTGGPIPFKKELGESKIEKACLRLLDIVASGYWAFARRII